jgi:asparagine synthase (glutamine-hydrolysing)
MCGIAGAFGPVAADRPLIEKMARAIVHRGPDHTGSHFSDSVALIMNRLAIIDLEGGNQPFFSSDGQVALVFNGEIYNFRELRDELKALVPFHTRSDTEVILNGYLIWGKEVFRRLNGIFAVAIHDRRKHQVLLARDPLGTKPLYVLRAGDAVYFASEVKSFTSTGLARRIDRNAVQQFLASGYVFCPTAAVEGVSQVEPGTLLEIDAGGVRSERYRQLAPAVEPRPRSAPAWRSHVRDALDRAVIGQTVSDVPYGLLLSSGIDSMAVLSILRRHGLAEHLRTFTLFYENESFSEDKAVRRLAAKWGFGNEQVRLDGAMVRSALPDLFRTFDNLEFLPTAAAIYFVSKLAGAQVKVVLAGNGGDELFLGYPTYMATRILENHGVLQRIARALAPYARRVGISDDYLTFAEKARRFLEGSTYGPGLAHVMWRHVFLPDQMDALFNAALRPSSPEIIYQPQLRYFEEAGALGYSGMGRLSWGDLKGWLVDHGLTMWDKAGMRFSAEIRVPLVDPDFVDAVLGVPAEIRGRPAGTKRFLRELLREDLPDEIRSLPKHGFQVPVAQWLRGPLGRDFRELCYSLPREIFVRSEIERLWQEFENRRGDHALQLWCLGCLAGWAQAHGLSW